MVRELEGEAVLLDLASGNYFGLNATGRRVWQLLCEGHSNAEVAERLLVEFSGSREEIESDLRQLLLELTREGLLVAEE
jgi:hypothetical protein